MKKDLEKDLEPWIKKYKTWHKTSMARSQRITFLLEFYDFLPYKGLIKSTIFRGIILNEMDTTAMNVLDGIHTFYKKRERK